MLPLNWIFPEKNALDAMIPVDVQLLQNPVDRHRLKGPGVDGSVVGHTKGAGLGAKPPGNVHEAAPGPGHSAKRGCVRVDDGHFVEGQQVFGTRRVADRPALRCSAGDADLLWTHCPPDLALVKEEGVLLARDSGVPSESLTTPSARSSGGPAVSASHAK